MGWRLSHFAILVILPFGAVGCSRSSTDATELLNADAAFSSPIALLLPATDDSQLYQNILNGSQAVGGLMVIMGCKGNLFQSAHIQNFSGALDVGGLVFDNWATIKSIQIPGERFDCTIYDENLQSAAQTLSSEFGGQPDDNQQNAIYLPIGKRTDIRITYTNEYETDVPGGGRTKMIAVTCNYTIEVSAKIKGLSSPGNGQCQGKWALDNDTGKWVKLGLSLSDPNFAVASPQIVSDVRTLSAATTSSNGDRILLEGQVVQCPPLSIQRRDCSFGDKGIFLSDTGGPPGRICIDPDPGPYRVTAYRGKDVIPASDQATLRTSILLTNSGKELLPVGYWLAGETCKLPPPSANSGPTGQIAVYLGVTTGTSDSIRIAGVYQGSPAQAAGLQVGDIFTKVQGFQINNRSGLESVVNSFNPGDHIQIVVNRSGQPLTFDVTLGSHSSSFLSNLFANLTGETRLAPATQPVKQASISQEQAAPQPGPSFNCQQAKTWSEKQICATSSLFAEDRHLAELYSGKIRSDQLAPQQKAQIRAAQRAWIAERDGCRTHADPGQCLSALYSVRLYELSH